MEDQERTAGAETGDGKTVCTEKNHAEICEKEERETTEITNDRRVTACPISGDGRTVPGDENTASGSANAVGTAGTVRGSRTATVTRKTAETEIALTLNLDGSGARSIHTGIGFFDHMLNGFAKHGFFDLELRAEGDLDVDCHHTVEDTGIVLGAAIREALGDKSGIRRYGSAILPMDETLVLCAIDLSGRPWLSFEAEFPSERTGGLDTETVREFFYAVSYSAGMNLHIRLLSGSNSHHMIEAMFKAFGKALDEAVSADPRVHGILSTKGSL